jgi:hypothetical protein
LVRELSQNGIQYVLSSLHRSFVCVIQSYEAEDNMIPVMEYLASDRKSALYMWEEDSEGNLK